MSFANLFVVRPPRSAQGGAIVAAGAVQGEPTAVFITPKSLGTFPVASSVVTFVWLLVRRLSENWGKSPWVPLAIALVLGAVILMGSTRDPDVRPRSPRDWVVAIVVGLLNALYLAASAMGLVRG